MYSKKNIFVGAQKNDEKLNKKKKNSELFPLIHKNPSTTFFNCEKFPTLTSFSKKPYENENKEKSFFASVDNELDIKKLDLDLFKTKTKYTKEKNFSIINKNANEEKEMKNYFSTEIGEKDISPIIFSPQTTETLKQNTNPIFQKEIGLKSPFYHSKKLTPISSKQLEKIKFIENIDVNSYSLPFKNTKLNFFKQEDEKLNSEKIPLIENPISNKETNENSKENEQNEENLNCLNKSRHQKDEKLHSKKISSIENPLLTDKNIKKIIQIKQISSTEPLTLKILKGICKTKTADLFYCKNLDKKGENVVLKRFKSKEGKRLGKNEKMILEKITKHAVLKDSKSFCKILGFDRDQKDPTYSYNLAIELGHENLDEKLKNQSKKINLKNFSINMIFVFSAFQKIGLYYRDIKPLNIMDDKLIDFDIALFLDDKICNESGEYELNLSGTPSYMAPEIYKLYEKYKSKNQMKENESDEDHNTTLKQFCKKKDKEISPKNIMESNIGEQIDLSYDEEHKTTLKKKKLKFYNDDIKTTTQASDCFKTDVFSLGLVLLKILFTNENIPIPIEKINKKEENLKEAIEELNKLRLSHTFSYDVISKMLVWDPIDRMDFIELEDFLIYEKSVSFTEFKYLRIDQKFTSLRTFNDIWEISDFKSINNHFFSAGYLSQTVDQNFTKTLLQIFYESEKSIFENLQKEIDLNLFDIKFGSYKIGNNLQIIKDLIRHYTKEGNFYKILNKSLGKNDLSLVSYIIFNCFRGKEFLTKTITNKYLYRVIVLNRENQSDIQFINWKFEARNQYFPGLSYYWPSFTSTTKSNKIKNNWLEDKSFESEDIILFLIKIDSNIKENKADISDFSCFPNEEEVLLYPYFHFKVIKNAPREVLIGNRFKTICEIEVEEIENKKINFSILWCDPMVNSTENKELQTVIRSKSGDCLKVFETIENFSSFINSKEMSFIVVTSGNIGKGLLDKFYHNSKIIQFILYVGNKDYHKEWAEKYIGSKLKAIVDEPFELLESLPNNNFII